MAISVDANTQVRGLQSEMTSFASDQSLSAEERLDGINSMGSHVVILRQRLQEEMLRDEEDRDNEEAEEKL